MTPLNNKQFRRCTWVVRLIGNTNVTMVRSRCRQFCSLNTYHCYLDCGCFLPSLCRRPLFLRIKFSYTAKTRHLPTTAFPFLPMYSKGVRCFWHCHWNNVNIWMDGLVCMRNANYRIPTNSARYFCCTAFAFLENLYVHTAAPAPCAWTFPYQTAQKCVNRQTHSILQLWASENVD